MIWFFPSLCEVVDEGCWAFQIFSLNANHIFYRYENGSFLLYSEISYAVVGSLKRVFTLCLFFPTFCTHIYQENNMLCVCFYILHAHLPGNLQLQHPKKKYRTIPLLCSKAPIYRNERNTFNPFLNGICNMWNHLNSLSQVVSFSFFINNRLIYFPVVILLSRVRITSKNPS